MTTRFVNRAHSDGQLPDDLAIAGELAQAGIPLMEGIKESFRKFLGGSPEVRTISVGELHGWVFHRHWSYWVAKGPGIPYEDAVALHEKQLAVRIEGHCADPHPREYTHGLGAGSYHIDTSEGLRALADTIKAVVARVDQPKTIRTLDDKDVKEDLDLLMTIMSGYSSSIAKIDAVRAIQRLQGKGALPRARPGDPEMNAMVDRFLGWKLPQDFSPDCGIAFDGRKDDEWNKNKTWPVGTNLFTADQVKSMLEYVVNGPSDQLEAPKQTGGCPEKAKPGGCQLHNLHCGYPKCDAPVKSNE